MDKLKGAKDMKKRLKKVLDWVLLFFGIVKNTDLGKWAESEKIIKTDYSESENENENEVKK